MPKPSQDNKLFKVITPLGKDKVLLRKLRGKEKISGLFEFELELFSADKNLDFTKIVGKSATVTFEFGDSYKRHLNGVVERFTQARSDTGDDKNAPMTTYLALLRPWLWQLTLTRNCRIFQNLSVPEIVKKIFDDLGFKDYQDKLKGTYPKRVYCVQYQESAFDFVSRLLEDEGIFYFFTHTEDKHTLVLADDLDAYPDCAGYKTVRYLEADDGSARENVVFECNQTHSLSSGKYAVDDFNFETPATDLLSEVKGKTGDMRVYEYDAGHAKKDHGDQIAKRRLEALEWRNRLLTGAAYTMGFVAGAKFTLSGHPRKDANIAWVINELEIQASQTDYRNTFEALPASVPFRPPLATPKPRITGTQTAIVTGKKGEEIWTDKYGRIKVQFHWDQEGKYDENSSCWVRVNQGWAGKNWGSLWIPRIGQEVVVSYLDSDPDMPLVTGAVYNAQQTVPYKLPDDQSKSTVKSQSFKGKGETAKSEEAKAKAAGKAGSDKATETKATTAKTAAQAGTSPLSLSLGLNLALNLRGAGSGGGAAIGLGDGPPPGLPVCPSYAELQALIHCHETDLNAAVAALLRAHVALCPACQERCRTLGSAMCRCLDLAADTTPAEEKKTENRPKPPWWPCLPGGQVLDIPADCPSSDKLAALGNNTLPAPEAEAIRQHVAGCTFCVSRCFNLGGAVWDSVAGVAAGKLAEVPPGCLDAGSEEAGVCPEKEALAQLMNPALNSVDAELLKKACKHPACLRMLADMAQAAGYLILLDRWTQYFALPAPATGTLLQPLNQMDHRLMRGDLDFVGFNHDGSRVRAEALTYARGQAEQVNRSEAEKKLKRDLLADLQPWLLDGSQALEAKLTGEFSPLIARELRAWRGQRAWESRDSAEDKAEGWAENWKWQGGWDWRDGGWQKPGSASAGSGSSTSSETNLSPDQERLRWEIRRELDYLECGPGRYCLASIESAARNALERELQYSLKQALQEDEASLLTSDADAPWRLRGAYAFLQGQISLHLLDRRLPERLEEEIRARIMPRLQAFGPESWGFPRTPPLLREYLVLSDEFEYLALWQGDRHLTVILREPATLIEVEGEAGKTLEARQSVVLLESATDYTWLSKTDYQVLRGKLATDAPDDMLILVDQQAMQTVSLSSGRNYVLLRDPKSGQMTLADSQSSRLIPWDDTVPPTAWQNKGFVNPGPAKRAEYAGNSDQSYHYVTLRDYQAAKVVLLPALSVDLILPKNAIIGGIPKSVPLQPTQSGTGCAEDRDLIKLLNNRLDGHQRVAWLSHLAGCGRCQARCAELAESKSYLVKLDAATLCRVFQAGRLKHSIKQLGKIPAFVESKGDTIWGWRARPAEEIALSPDLVPPDASEADKRPLGGLFLESRWEKKYSLLRSGQAMFVVLEGDTPEDKIVLNQETAQIAPDKRDQYLVLRDDASGNVVLLNYVGSRLFPLLYNGKYLVAENPDTHKLRVVTDRAGFILIDDTSDAIQPEGLEDFVLETYPATLALLWDQRDIGYLVVPEILLEDTDEAAEEEAESANAEAAEQAATGAETPGASTPSLPALPSGSPPAGGGLTLDSAPAGPILPNLLLGLLQLPSLPGLPALPSLNLSLPSIAGPKLPGATGAVAKAATRQAGKQSKAGTVVQGKAPDPGFNEIRFDDKTDKEEIFVHAQKDLNVKVWNDETRVIKMNRKVTIEEKDDSLTVAKGSRTVLIKKARTTTIEEEDDKLNIDKGSRIILIKQKDYKLTLEKGDRYLEVKTGKEDHKVKGTRDLKVDGKETHLNQADFTHKVQGNYVLKVTGNLTIDVTGNVVIKSSQGIEMKAGMDVKIKAGMNMKQEAGVNLDAKAGVNMKLEAGVNLDAKAGVMMKNKAGVMMKNEGGVMMDNKGGVMMKNKGGVMLSNEGGVLHEGKGGAILMLKGGIVMIN